MTVGTLNHLPDSIELSPTTDTEVYHRQLEDQEVALLAGHGLSQQCRVAICRLASQALDAAESMTFTNPNTVEGYQYIRGRDFGGLGSRATGFTVEKGFSRLDIPANLPGLTGSPHSILQKGILGLLPAARRSFSYEGIRVPLKRITVVRYLPGHDLAYDAPRGAALEGVLVHGFPIDRGHRDGGLPPFGVVESEQVAGQPVQWEAMSTRGHFYRFGQTTGQRVAMRGKTETSEGQPWHYVQNSADEPRLAILLAYVPNSIK